MRIHERLRAFDILGKHFNDIESLEIRKLIEDASLSNPWFTPQNVSRSLSALAKLLNTEKLSNWLMPYGFDEDLKKEVGLVFAGNIPLVGFHDLLAVLGAGFRAQVKLSMQDQVLTKYVIKELIKIEPAFSDRIRIVDRLQHFDLVIATGSDNSARYFEYYFGKFPHIIRKNRNSVAILNGKETTSELMLLGDDIFSYYGLGCRNVSKLYLPTDYNVSFFFEGISGFQYIQDHYKYINNYDFNKSLYLINGDPHFDNGFLLLKPAVSLTSPLAVMHFEEYSSTNHLEELINESASTIQCVVADISNAAHLNLRAPIVPFGQSQYPGLEDYADGINTLDFLAKYKS